MNRPWTGAEEQRLKTLLAQYQTLEAIARQLNRSRHAVYLRVRRRRYSRWEGRTYRTWTKQEDNELIQRRAHKQSIAQIAEALNRTESAVTSRIGRTLKLNPQKEDRP
jgi:predicted transcriptional regulator